MKIPTRISRLLCGIVLARTSAVAQTQPAIRQIGRVDRVSREALASVATAVPLAGGRVLVNDIVGHRVVLFDSTLTDVHAVADTTSATANAYGRSAGTLIRYRADSALFIDPFSLSMYVIGPTGAVVRIKAMPSSNDIRGFYGGPFGTPGFDAAGRLVYFSGELLGDLPILRRGVRVPTDPRAPSPIRAQLEHRFDSAFVARVDLATRTVDTLTSIKVPRFERTLKIDGQGLLLAMEQTPDPLPLVDDWAAMPDGSIAVVRGRDFHIDWLGADGRWASLPKMPFDWKHVSDDRKNVLIDSAVTALQTMLDTTVNMLSGRGVGGGARGDPRSARRDTDPSPIQASAWPPNIIPLVPARAALADIPDYVPPFTRGALHPDAEGNLWIRTTTINGGQPVYDVVNRRGMLIDRVQLPPFRTIAGFGPGVIYMAVQDSTRSVHLERARIR